MRFSNPATLRRTAGSRYSNTWGCEDLSHFESDHLVKQRLCRHRVATVTQSGVTPRSVFSLVWILLVVAAPAKVFGEDVKIVAVTNTTGLAAADLHVTFTGTGGNISVVPESVTAGACPIPTVPSNGMVTNTAVIDWGAACVPAGGAVVFVASTTNGPLAFASGFWTDVAGNDIGPIKPDDIEVDELTGGPATMTVDISALVRPPCGGRGAERQIGSVAVTTQGGQTENTDGRFTFTEGLEWVDKWYDFRWVNVLAVSIVNGVPERADADGAFPQIDPGPGDGPEPYYYNEDEWSSGLFGATVIHDECVESRFCDNRGSPAGTIWIFNTYLVIADVTAGQLEPKEFCVLDGFSWFSRGQAMGPNTTGIIGAIGANPTLIAAAIANANAPGFPGWAALDAAECSLQACPPQVTLTYDFQSLDRNTGCCVFEWNITNIGSLPIGEFYMDLEAGSSTVGCREFTLPGWTNEHCYPWDFAQPSNWGVICFMSPDKDMDGEPDDPLLPGETRRGTVNIEVNGDSDVAVDIANWHPFIVPANALQAHVTDYSPICLGVDCAEGQFGPYIANDLYERDQSCFWSGPCNLVCDKCPEDLDNDEDVDASDLIILLGVWGPGHDPGVPPEFDCDGFVGTTDLIRLLGAWGPCPPE